MSMLAAFVNELSLLHKEAAALDPITHAVARGMVRMRETPQRAAAILDFYRKRIGRDMSGGRGHTFFFGEGVQPISGAAVRAGSKQPKGILAYHQSGSGIEPTTILRPDMKVDGVREIVSKDLFVMPTTGLATLPSKDIPGLAQMLREPGKHEEVFRKLKEVGGIDVDDLKHWEARPDRESLEEVLRKLKIEPKPSEGPTFRWGR